MNQLLNLISDVIVNAISIYTVLLVIYILMSWVPSTRETAIGKFIGKLAEPYLEVFRRFIPPIGMIDISPLVGIFALRYIGRGIELVFQIIIN